MFEVRALLCSSRRTRGGTLAAWPSRVRRSAGVGHDVGLRAPAWAVGQPRQPFRAGFRVGYSLATINEAARCALRRVRSVVNSKLDFTEKEPLGSGFNPPVIGEDTPNVRRCSSLLQHVPSTGKAPAATACKFAALPRAIRSKARQSPPLNATTLSESAWPLSPQHVWCQQEKCSKTRAGCGVAGCWVAGFARHG